MARLDEVRFDAAKLTKTSAAEYSSSESDGDEEDEYLMPSRNPHDDEFAGHNPRKRRRTGRDAKESAALGIFGSESDDDDGPAGRWKRKNLRAKGVSFVSSARAAAASDEDKDEEDDDDDDDDDDDEEDEDDKRPSMRAMNPDADDADEDDEDAGGVGLGFGGGGAAIQGMGMGLGWVPPTLKHKPAAKDSHSRSEQPFVKPSVAPSNPLGPGFMPSSAQVPTLLAQDDDEPSTPHAAMPSAFSQTKGGKTKINAGSFGARMMAKMGYVPGKGLGKEEQGRNVIIEANLRPQKAGLGAVREKTEQERQEEKRQARLRGEVLEDSDDEKKKKAARRKKALAGGVSSTPGSGASTPRRQKPKYLTMDEVKKVAPGLNIPDAFTPILDLTGPGKKMLTSSSGLMTPTGASAPAESAESAESRKLVRRAQNDLMAVLEEWQSLQERKAYLELQLQQEKQEWEEVMGSLRGNQSVTAACETLMEPVESGELDEKANLAWKLNRIIRGLRDANSAVSEAILPQVQEEMSSLAVAAIHPTFKDFLRYWEPLAEPRPSFVDGLNSIRGLLGLDHPAKKARRATATPWETLMFKLWLPTVASAVREWSVKEPDQMIAVFEAWDKLMPAFVRTQLLEQDIVRKLDEAVQKWQPKKKSSHSHSLPHGWIFPWLPYLPAHHLDPKSATGLVADVKRKFRQLIDVWEFDRGVIPGFQKWKEVLRPSKSRDQWAPLVMNHVLPSMAKYIRTNFRVLPQDQAPYMEMLEGLFKWLEVLSPSMLGEVMVAEIFPMWHDALYQWLLLDDADYGEIGQWFEWWQESVFPDEIRALPSIDAEFNKGTNLIDRALDLGDRAKAELKAPERGPAFRTTKLPSRDKGPKHRDPPAPQPAPAQQAEEVTFRSVMEDWCQENDLQFIPERKKVHAEGPMYRITARGDGKGGVLVYFKGDILFAERRNNSPLEIRRDQPEMLDLLQDMAS